MTANMLAQQKKDEDTDRQRRLAQEDEMARLESQVLQDQQQEEERKRMTTAPGAGAITFTGAREEPVEAEANPEEIELGDEEEEEGEEEGVKEGAEAAAEPKGKAVKIEQMELPSTLFGGLKEQADKEREQQPQQMGALARFQRGGKD